MLQGLFKRQLVSKETKRLGAFTTDAAGQLDVLGHDGDTFGVDGAQVGVFEEADKVGFRGFLKGKNGRPLESKVGLEVLGDFTNQALERKLADQEIGRFLVSADFTKGNCSRAVAVGFLDPAGGGRGFARGLGGQLLAGGFAAGGFTCSLLCTGHFVYKFDIQMCMCVG